MPAERAEPSTFLRADRLRRKGGLAVGKHRASWQISLPGPSCRCTGRLVDARAPPKAKSRFSTAFLSRLSRLSVQGNLREVPNSKLKSDFPGAKIFFFGRHRRPLSLVVYCHALQSLNTWTSFWRPSRRRSTCSSAAPQDQTLFGRFLPCYWMKRGRHHCRLHCAGRACLLSWHAQKMPRVADPQVPPGLVVLSPKTGYSSQLDVVLTSFQTSFHEHWSQMISKVKNDFHDHIFFMASEFSKLNFWPKGKIFLPLCWWTGRGPQVKQIYI